MDSYITSLITKYKISNKLIVRLCKIVVGILKCPRNIENQIIEACFGFTILLRIHKKFYSSFHLLKKYYIVIRDAVPTSPCHLTF